MNIALAILATLTIGQSIYSFVIRGMCRQIEGADRIRDIQYDRCMDLIWSMRDAILSDAPRDHLTIEEICAIITNPNLPKTMDQRFNEAFPDFESNPIGALAPFDPSKPN